MLCSQPLTVHTTSGPALAGCGQCLPCLINKRRAWTARILLEGLGTEALHKHVSWATMTYANENVPQVARGGSCPEDTLSLSDYQSAHRRMRRDLGSFRFFLVGEYGDETERPHYHALYFGPDPLRLEWALKEHWESRFGHVRVRPWRMGDRHTGTEIAVKRASYCSGYVVKKMTSGDDNRLGGRVPEFNRCSRRPGIGATSKLYDLCMSRGGATHLAETGDVPRTIRIAGKLWPLAPKLREHLRGVLGVPSTHAERQAINPVATPKRATTLRDHEDSGRRAFRLVANERRPL